MCLPCFVLIELCLIHQGDTGGWCWFPPNPPVWLAAKFSFYSSPEQLEIEETALFYQQVAVVYIRLVWFSRFTIIVAVAHSELKFACPKPSVGCKLKCTLKERVASFSHQESPPVCESGRCSFKNNFRQYSYKLVNVILTWDLLSHRCITVVKV